MRDFVDIVEQGRDIRYTAVEITANSGKLGDGRPLIIASAWHRP
jgi:hypothetical protein